MNEVSIIGIDLAKRVFQLHGAAADGSVVFRRKLPRAKVLPFLASQPGCIVAMRGGSVCLNTLWGVSKWLRRPFQAAAGIGVATLMYA